MEQSKLIWYRKDLRTVDNIVLAEATKKPGKLIAVYCFNPRHFTTDNYGFKKTGKFRTQFLIETVHQLKVQLKTLNISLLVYQNAPEIVIPKLCKTYNINQVFYQKEWTYEEKLTENAIKQQLKDITFNSYYNQFLYHPETINFKIKDTAAIFSDFRKKLEKQIDVKPEVLATKQPQSNLITATNKIPELIDFGFKPLSTVSYTAFPFKGGETEALKRLKHYFFNTKKITSYKKTRNELIGIDYSSKFSAWLANGSLSPKTIFWEIKNFENQYYKNQSTYWLIFELIWRDYFKYISMKHGNKIFKQNGIIDKINKWSYNQETVQRWINGNTDSDFVNANMNELKSTGWMSNRGRQNVASYFAKHLKQDWRIGAAYFESTLIDFDVHSNYGNWTYISGVGNDPRGRKFNVELQANRYDSDKKYRNLWLQTQLKKA